MHKWLNKDRSLSYRVYELKNPVTEEEIKKTYRRLAKKWHPARNPGNPDAEERFKEIQQTYDFLICEERMPAQNTENQ